MKVLWVTAQELPMISSELGTEVHGFGGWVTNMLNLLKMDDSIELGVAMVSTKVSTLWEKRIDNIECFVAPDCGGKAISDETRNSIIAKFNPDIIHIEGNEFQIQNAFAKTKIKTLLSLQGILSGYEPYQYGCLPIADAMFSIKSHNILSSWILFFRKHILFDKRISMETNSIQSVSYISGRTFWDRAHSYWINPKAKYFPCNRILRPQFYKENWDVNKMKPFTIFIGNGYSPLKGLHFVIEAVNLLKQRYPNIQLLVAGNSPIYNGSIFSAKRYGYSSIIKQLIRKNRLDNNVYFLGALNGHKMIDIMKTCNVYVLPSLIENSPNTLGEAMIMGMPCVSAYTGGASEMAIDEKECLFYRSNDPKLLAWQIKRIFDDPNFAVELGQNAKKHAMHTHDPYLNKNALIYAYNKIYNE